MLNPYMGRVGKAICCPQPQHPLLEDSWIVSVAIAGGNTRIIMEEQNIREEEIKQVKALLFEGPYKGSQTQSVKVSETQN